MPQGKGTYGSQVGRPRKKYNTGGPGPAPEIIESFENIPTREERKNNMLDDVMLSVRRRRELIELGMPEDEAQKSLDTIIRNAKGFGVTRSDVLGLDAQVVQELQEAALEPLKIQKQIEALQGNTDRVPYVRGGISKLAEKLSRKLSSLRNEKDRLNKNLREPIGKKKQRQYAKEIREIDTQIDDVNVELAEQSELKRQETTFEATAQLEGEKSDIANQLRARGFGDEKIEELLEKAYELRSPAELEEALSMPERPTKPDSIILEGSQEFDREFDIMKDQKLSIIKADEKARLAKEVAKFRKGKRLTDSDEQKLIKHYHKANERLFPDEDAWVFENETNPSYDPEDMARQIKQSYNEMIDGTAEFEDGFFITNAYGLDGWMNYQTVYDILGKGRTKKAVGGELVAIDETYSDIKSLLSKKQDKAIQNIIAQKRIKDYSVLGRGMNMADKATSLAVRGNTDIVIEDFDEKEMYIALGQKMLDSEKRTKKQEGGELDDQMSMLMEEEETHTMPDGTVMPGATHEEYEQMLPDEEMEEDYVEYVFDSTLNPQDKEYLENALAEDAKLSEIIDIVVESTTEFSGSGLLEGPGTGKSDSIPARLSDGEFVMTAKATEEIGSDNLMSMMKEAEAAADTRQKVAYGGYMTEMENETVPIQTLGVREARRNIPQVAQTQRQVEEEMLKASPRRFYQPISG